VLHAARTGPIPASQLASELKRDRQAVMRDVRLLESFGFPKTRAAPNPGHGRHKIVAPLAASYQLVANI
jgi:predicted transcriptional regulator